MRHKGGEQRKMSQPIRGFAAGITDSVGAEAVNRIAGREALLGRICKLAKAEAAERSLRVNKLSIHAAWSHEYDEQTGVIVDIDVTASDEDRFSYWEALNERLDELAASLSQPDRDWLQSDLSLTVVRS